VEESWKLLPFRLTPNLFIHSGSPLFFSENDAFGPAVIFVIGVCAREGAAGFVLATGAENLFIHEGPAAMSSSLLSDESSREYAIVASTKMRVDFYIRSIASL
jgi:hypothetical protein